MSKRIKIFQSIEKKRKLLYNDKYACVKALNFVRLLHKFCSSARLNIAKRKNEGKDEIYNFD